MAQLRRADLYSLVLTKILTGGRRTTGEALREVLDAIIESAVNAENDGDINLGYLKIDSSGKADVTKIKQDTPASLFLRDNGSWANPALLAVLTGYTSGAGTVAATDTILQAIQKLNGNYAANNAVLTGLSIAPGHVSASDTILQAFGKLQGKLPVSREHTGTDDIIPWEPFIPNDAGLTTARLPTTCAAGDRLYVYGKGAGGWRITQAAGQQIVSAVNSTTSGTGGRLDSSNRYDCVEMICITADTLFLIVNNTGTLTYT